MAISHTQTLRTMLRDEKGIILPGAPNAIAARIIADLGFRAVYLTGAGLTNTYLGLPDLGFMDLSQVANHVMAIRCVIDLPLLVDVDTGFGNAINVTHTVRVLEQAGASAIQIEDQHAPKRCGHFDGKLEPRRVKEEEGSSLEWGVAEVLRKMRRVPDFIYDEGDVGKEPMIRVLGKDPMEVIQKVLKVAGRR